MADTSIAAAAPLRLLLALCLTVGCAGAPESVPAPDAGVAVIGWDGATWRVIDPLLRQGRLPNLERLLERGSRGVLLAERPMYSPSLWTSLATGFPPSMHGVTDFQLPDPEGTGLVLAASFHRRRAPVWSIASAFDRSVGFVGWWTTWPAETVNGYMVSDHLAYNRWDAWARRAEGQDYRLTFPAELADELAVHAVRPDDVDARTISALVPFDEGELQELLRADRPVKFHAPSVMRFGYATDASVARFATHLLDSREQPDLFAAVFILSDVAGHVFWHHYEPEAFPGMRDDPGRLAEAIPNVYAQLDSWTGEILDRLDPDTRIILLSDHGMGPEGTLPVPDRNPAAFHRRDGILVVSGPGVTAGADLGEVSMLDVAPTLLALLGLPLARDLPGRVMAAAFPEIDLGQSWVDSYGDGRSQLPPLPSPGAEDYEERLRALGYIE